MRYVVLCCLFFTMIGGPVVAPSGAQNKKPEPKVKAPPPPWKAPELPGGKAFVSETSDAFLKPQPNLREGVLIAKTAPKVDFAFLPGQTYKASIWSNWGDSLAVNGKYYCAIGDHIGPEGNAFVYELDPKTMVMRVLVNLRELLQVVMGNYTPGKIHSRIDMGKDGKLYFSTHRGSTAVTNEKYGYKGDWIISVDPKTGKTEIVAEAPVPKHCLPASVLDPDRMIFYAGSAPGTKSDGPVQFLAYDVVNKKEIFRCPNGPGRVMIFARSTGKIYYSPSAYESTDFVCFDPAQPGQPKPIKLNMYVRAVSDETKDGVVYLLGNRGEKGIFLYAFNTKSETVEELGPAAVATKDYTTSIDVDPTGRYIYYVPGAHGGAQTDGSPVVQFDAKTRTRKVIAFLSPYFKEKYGADPVGTYATAIDPAGDKLYITWNVDRAVARHWDCCAVTVVHIPESERQP